MKNEMKNEVLETASNTQNLPSETLPDTSFFELLNSEFTNAYELTASYFDPKIIEVGEVLNIICTRKTIFVDSQSVEKPAIQFVALINGTEQSFISAATILVGSLGNSNTYPFKASIVYLGKVKAKFTYDNFKVYLCK